MPIQKIQKAWSELISCIRVATVAIRTRTVLQKFFQDQIDEGRNLIRLRGSFWPSNGIFRFFQARIHFRDIQESKINHFPRVCMCSWTVKADLNS